MFNAYLAPTLAGTLLGAQETNRHGLCPRGGEGEGQSNDCLLNTLITCMEKESEVQQLIICREPLQTSDHCEDKEYKPFLYPLCPSASSICTASLYLH